MTDPERELFLKALSSLIVEDFGPANTDGTFEALCPHCQIHHALRTIESLYAITEPRQPKDDDDLEGFMDSMLAM